MNEQFDLQELKKGILLTGRIPGPILNSLKHYPYIVFDDIKSLEMSYDIVTDPTAEVPGKGSIVNYKVGLDRLPSEHMQKRLDWLTGAVKTLLWSNITVNVLNEYGEKLSERQSASNDLK